jgi:hypothetical protein
MILQRDPGRLETVTLVICHATRIKDKAAGKEKEEILKKGFIRVRCACTRVMPFYALLMCC